MMNPHARKTVCLYEYQYSYPRLADRFFPTLSVDDFVVTTYIFVYGFLPGKLSRKENSLKKYHCASNKNDNYLSF